MTATAAMPIQPRLTQSNTPNEASDPLSFHLGEEAIGGFAAGVVGTLLGFPLDLVKTRMQTQATNDKLSPLRLLRHIVKTEGVSSLYKGVGEVEQRQWLFLHQVCNARPEGNMFPFFSLPLVEGESRSFCSHQPLFL
jgi:hypothetical protein